LKMFKALLADVSVLRDSLDAVSSLINEGTFTINNDGLFLQAMDPSTVSMVIFHLLSSAFVDFKVDKEHKLTVNIDALVQVLRRANVTDQIILELDEEKNKLLIRMRGSSVRTFSLPLISDEGKQQNAPDLKFPCKVEIEAGVFKEGIKDALMISDFIILNVKNNVFTMKSSGDSSSTKLVLDQDSPSLISIEHSSECTAKYSLDYLEKMSRAAKVADTLVLQFGTDYPLRMDYKTLDKLSLTFILAPRVENE